MENLLQYVITESGIWDGEQRESHKFLLSPSVFRVSLNQENSLRELGPAINDCLLGISHIAIIALDEKANYSRDAWPLIRKVFSTGIPKIYHEFQGQNLREIPKLLKVDFMVDQSGNFKIAEIDGHNKHGVGYSTLALLFREKLYSGSKAFTGVVFELAKEIERMGRSELVILYADQEKFYLPEFKVMQKEFLKYQIDCFVISEKEAVGKDFAGKLLLDIPFLYREANLNIEIMERYRNKDISCIIPPKPFMGSKGILALLRNDIKNEHLESILNTFIKKSSLDLVRSYIPETYLIGKDAMGISPITTDNRRFVLKESISSGMKGVFFSEDKDSFSFEKAMKIAKNTKLNWILQEEVINQPQTLSWYEESFKKCKRPHSGENELERVAKENTSSDWFLRVTAHYVNRKIADLIVTARRDRAVHGAKDCLQIGAIIE